MPTVPAILIINCGSSSIKFAVVAPDNEETLLEGLIENLGSNDVMLHWECNGIKEQRPLSTLKHDEAIKTIVPIIEASNTKITAIGHRVVHGGESFKTSTLIDASVITAIQACANLAPLHNPANLLGIKATQAAFPGLPQVAVFDTAFHQTIPAHAYLYAIPYVLYQDQGIRRYGFHGTSHHYVTMKAAEQLNLPLDDSAFLSAHLGNGCSASAVLNGKSIDTTMGLTPLEGLVMGTRSGDVDPGLHAHLAKQLDLSLDEINDLLNKESGLLGISDLSMDMRTLCDAAEQGHTQAALAIEIFCYRLAKYLGALAVPLGRIDALIFTGGIGEHAALIRAKVINKLGILGFTLDETHNASHGKNNNGLITQADSTTAIVIRTDEQLQIARETQALVTNFKDGLTAQSMFQSEEKLDKKTSVSPRPIMKK